MSHYQFRKIVAAILAVFIALTIGGRIFLKSETKDTGGLKPFIISGSSMEPTVVDGDEVFTDLLYYKTHPVAKGDIVAISFSLSANKIKRVIAVGGDHVVFSEDGRILVNDTASPTNYLKDSGMQFNPSRLRILKIQLGEAGIIPEGSLLVLGDNRFPSEDSQQFGLVPAEQVMGKVLYKKVGWRNVTL